MRVPVIEKKEDIEVRNTDLIYRLGSCWRFQDLEEIQKESKYEITLNWKELF